MSYQQYKEAFDRDGFVVVKNFVAGGEFQELERNLHRYIHEVVPALSETEAFYQDPDRPETLKQLQHMQGDEFFGEMMVRPKWLSLAETMLGEPCENHGGPEWFNKPPNTEHPTPPHQDNFYFKYAPPLALTIWLAMEPIDQENGCLRYLPGSHRRGIRPHARSHVLGFSQTVSDWSDQDEEAEARVELRAGDAVVHHAEIIHWADANRSSVRHRRAYAHVYKAIRARPDEAAVVEYEEALRTHLAAPDVK